jgi:hypothetical protein
MGVDHGVDDVVVAHQLISRADVLAGLQQMTDTTWTQVMTEPRGVRKAVSRLWRESAEARTTLRKAF